MRILVLTNMYPPQHFGGYELSCRDVMVRLAAAGEDVRILTSDVKIPGVADEADPGVEGVHRELEIYWRDHVLVSPSIAERLRIERRNQHRLRRHLAEFQPDVVSAWNMGAMSLGLLATVLDEDIPLLLAVSNDWLCEGPQLDAWTRAVGVLGPVGRALARRVGAPSAPTALGQRATSCFVSDFTRQRAVEQSRWRITDSTVVYCGIELSEFSPGRDQGGEGSGPRLLYTGRLDGRKGVFTLLDVLRHLPSTATLTYIGRGDLAVEQGLRDRAAAMGVGERVRISSSDRSSLKDFYQAADVLVFPSEWDEPFGLTPLEAMACGVPVVGTGTGGSAEFLVDGWNYVHFPPGDATSLARAVRAVMGDPALRRRVVQNGLATSSQLHTDALAVTFHEWHRAVAERFRHGRPPDRRLEIGPR